MPTLDVEYMGRLQPLEASSDEGDNRGDPAEESSDGSDGEKEDENVDDSETESDSDEWKPTETGAEYKIDAFSPGTVGVNIPIDPSATSLDFFHLFFDETFFQRVVDETNRYAAQDMRLTAAIAAARAAVAAASSSDEEDDSPVDGPWTDTTLPEIRAFIAMNIALGLRGHSSMDDIWSTRDSLHDPYLSKIMSRDRFRLLSKYFRLVDNASGLDQDHPDYDALYKISPMIHLFNTQSADLYSPKQQLSVDEAMVKFKGRHHAKQYMPMKPTKYGFKVWVCAEAITGYALQVEVYEGKARTPARLKLRSTYGVGYDIVTELTRQYQGKNHIVYYDRWFSSVPLAEHLLRNGIYANSTIKQDRAGLPPGSRKLKLKKTDSCRQQRKGNSNLLFTVFYEKRQVAHLSTGCLPGQHEGGVKPLVNVDYNKYMGGVDLCDQHCSYYRVGNKTVKWWKYLFWHFISLAINNAYVIYKASALPLTATGGVARQKALKTHKMFRLEIMEQLVGTFSRPVQVKRLRASPGVVLQNSDAMIAHICQLSADQRLCHYCNRGREGGKVRTRYVCKDCNVNLCAAGCFQRYHADLCGISTN